MINVYIECFIMFYILYNIDDCRCMLFSPTIASLASHKILRTAAVCVAWYPGRPTVRVNEGSSGPSLRQCTASKTELNIQVSLELLNLKLFE